MDSEYILFAILAIVPVGYVLAWIYLLLKNVL
jgi:hypothetical protein